MANILIHTDIHIIRLVIVFIHLHIHFAMIYILTKALTTVFVITNAMKIVSVCEVVYINITSQTETYPIVNVIITEKVFTEALRRSICVRFPHFRPKEKTKYLRESHGCISG